MLRRNILRCRQFDHEQTDPRQALADPHLCRPFDGRQVERALSHQSGARADRPVGRLRSADPDRLRLRSSAGQGRGRQGRRADQPSRRHAHPVRRHPARPHEHLDDHQRAGGVAAVALYRDRRGAGRRARQAAGHDAERHHQGISLARDLHLPARAVAAADRRHDRLHLSRGSQVEPDERLQLSPAGSRRDADAGAGLRARPTRSPCSTRCARAARCPRRISRRWSGRISFFVNAGIRFVTEMCKMRAFAELWDDITLQPLRRRRRQAAAVPLRRAGELARPHRAAAGEQRLPHPARDAGRGDEQERARPLGAAAGLERGARPAAAVGPAMVAAPAADRGLRDRPAGIRRHLRRQHRDRAQGRGAEGRGAGRDGSASPTWAARWPRSTRPT